VRVDRIILSTLGCGLRSGDFTCWLLVPADLHTLVGIIQVWTGLTMHMDIRADRAGWRAWVCLLKPNACTWMRYDVSPSVVSPHHARRYHLGLLFFFFFHCSWLCIGGVETRAAVVLECCQWQPVMVRTDTVCWIGHTPCLCSCYM
jgi:hypothetical protein